MLNQISCDDCLIKGNCQKDLKRTKTLCLDFTMRCQERDDAGKKCQRKLVPTQRHWALDGRLKSATLECPKCGSVFSIHSQPKESEDE